MREGEARELENLYLRSVASVPAGYISIRLVAIEMPSGEWVVSVEEWREEDHSANGYWWRVGIISAYSTDGGYTRAF